MILAGRSLVPCQALNQSRHAVLGHNAQHVGKRRGVPWISLRKSFRGPSLHLERISFWDANRLQQR